MRIARVWWVFEKMSVRDGLRVRMPRVRLLSSLNPCLRNRRVGEPRIRFLLTIKREQICISTNLGLLLPS